jgi:catecholate siderophore receptor
MSRRSRAARKPAPAGAPRSSAAASPAPLVPLGALAAGFGLLLVSGGASAQTAVPTPPASASTPASTEAVLPEVKVKGVAEESSKDNLQTNRTNIGKGTQDIRDIPQSINVVTEKLINDARLDTLRQALHYTAGITFAATENGTDQDIRMRGFPVASTGDLLIDGMKDPSQYDRDSFNYDRIEVMRGSASMLFGRGSTGGVINQVTKKPQLMDLTQVLATVGTGYSRRVTGDFNIRTGEESALRINAMYNTAENYGARIKKEGLAPTYSWGIGTKDEFTVGLFHLNVNNTPMNSLRYLDGTVATSISPEKFYGTASDYLKGEANYGTGSWKHRFDDGGELRTQFRTGTYRRDTWPTAAGYCSVALTTAGACPAGAPAVTNESLGSMTRITRSGLAPRKDNIRGTYVQSDYSNKFNWFGLRNDVLMGVDGAVEAADRYGAWGTVGTNFNKGGTTLGWPDDGQVVNISPKYRKTSDYAGRSFGTYFQDLLWLTPNWKLLGGIRYDRFSADMNQINYANATTANAVSTSSSKLSYPSLWSYRTGVLYQPTATQSYHISYGTSFNTSADTYQYTTQAIANVPAEKSQNTEIGAKLDWLEGNLSTRFALYRTEKFNERTTDADFAGTTPVLSGKRHSQGFEMDIVGRITPKLEVYVSYSLIQEAKIDQVGTAATGAGQPVGLSPRHSGAVWLSYQALPKLRFAGGARGASENRPLLGTSGAASQVAKAPGYVVYDAMAEYTFTPDLFAQVNITNLANKTYGDQLYPGFYTVGEPRSVKLTLGYRY